MTQRASKRLRVTKKEVEILQAIPPLLEKVQAGFELTNKALACVRDQYKLQEQTQKDLAAFAAGYSSDKVSAKYSMAQIQGLKANLEQIEWQLTGPRSETKVAIKPVGNKMLSSLVNMLSTLKSIQSETKEQHTSLMNAFKELTAAISGLPSNPSGSAMNDINSYDPNTGKCSAPSGKSSDSRAYGQPGYVAPGAMHQTMGRGGMPGMRAPAATLPPAALRVTVRDQAGHTMDIPVSPTGHLPSERLDQRYSSEFGLEVNGCLHRRLPQQFLP